MNRKTESNRNRGRRKALPRAMPKPTQMEKLYAVLSDGRWHSTKELVRRVGHCFGYSIFKLRLYGHSIEKDAHPTKKWQYRYRMTDGPPPNLPVER